jgi:hypothetical protein
MVHAGHMTIVPRDRDRVPTSTTDSAAISGVTAPEYSIALLEIFRFGSGHAAPPSFFFGAGDLLDKSDDGTPKPCVLNVHEGFGEMKPIGGGQKIGYVLWRRSVGLCMVLSAHVRSPFKEELDPSDLSGDRNRQAARLSPRSRWRSAANRPLQPN